MGKTTTTTADETVATTAEATAEATETAEATAEAVTDTVDSNTTAETTAEDVKPIETVTETPAKETVVEEEKVKAVTFVCTHYPDLLIACGAEMVQFMQGKLVAKTKQLIDTVKNTTYFDSGIISIEK